MKKNVTNPDTLKNPNADEDLVGFQILSCEIRHSHNLTTTGMDYQLYEFKLKLLNLKTKEEIYIPWLGALEPTANKIEHDLSALLGANRSNNRTVN